MGEFEEKLAQAEASEGLTKLALSEEAVALAGADVRFGYMARKLVVEAATFAGRPEKALVAFSWLLGQSDRDPEQFPETDLLWEYKWVADNLPGFPQISRAKIEETHADMERRYLRCGVSLRPVHKIRCTAAMAMGDLEAARVQYRLWVEARRDWVSDCPACDQDAQVHGLVVEGRDAEALERAAPILDGRMRCEGVPHTTLGTVLLPLVRLGRWEEAARCHLRGERLIERSRRWVSPAADHLRFLALSRNRERAERAVHERMSWALETPDLGRRFAFFLAVRLHGALGGSAPATLEGDLRELARRFDERNGNDHFTRQIAATDALVPLARSFPLA